MHGRVGDGRSWNLIGRYVDQAKINWAHVALAQLIEAGYVDRVLTTNFDPLVSRACALINVFPAVYDFAASHEFKPDQVGKQAVFHLHGQRDGFILLNTAAEVQTHRKHIKPVFDDAHSGRMWIVVGYSGDNDPVFDLLAKTKAFEYGLYWIGRNRVRQNTSRKTYLFKIKGHIFSATGTRTISLSLSLQRLGCFPPKCLRQPFTYLKSTLAKLADYKTPHQTGRVDITARVRDELTKLIDSHEGFVSAEYHFLAGEYDQVIAVLGRQKIKKLSSWIEMFWLGHCLSKVTSFTMKRKRAILKVCSGRP